MAEEDRCRAKAEPGSCPLVEALAGRACHLISGTEVDQMRKTAGRQPPSLPLPRSVVYAPTLPRHDSLDPLQSRRCAVASLEVGTGAGIGAV